MRNQYSLLLCILFHFLLHVIGVASIGINYGTLGDNLPPPVEVANFIKTRTIFNRVKIFDTNPDILRAFANTGIAVTVTALNQDIPALADLGYARQWVAVNIAPFYPQTRIVRILVGNEILLFGDSNMIANLVPAMKNLHSALTLAGLRGIQVTTSHSLAILQNPVWPSVCRFKPIDLQTLLPMLQFLRETKSPFSINPYPYFSYNPKMENYAVFKPNRGVRDRFTKITYTNMYDALLDSTYSAMKAVGYADVPIMVSETGWPSMGGVGEPAPTLANAISYNANLVKRALSRKGTPLMPNRRFETYIFALFNENQKPGPIAERNFGLFQPDFTPVYDVGIMRQRQLMIFQAPALGKKWCVPIQGASDQALQSNIDYVCSSGIDCKPIQVGGLCFEPNTVRAHAAYIMNSYYQQNGRQDANCDFSNTGQVTNVDPSYNSCRYT